VGTSDTEIGSGSGVGSTVGTGVGGETGGRLGVASGRVTTSGFSLIGATTNDPGNSALGDPLMGRNGIGGNGDDDQYVTCRKKRRFETGNQGEGFDRTGR